MRYTAVLLTLQLAVTALAWAEPPGTRYCALVIKHQFEDYDCPYSFYMRWSDREDFKKTTLGAGRVTRYWLICKPGDPCEGEMQVQFDSAGGDGVTVSRYWLRCISSETKEGPAAKYVFFFRGTDPALEGTVDSLDVAKKRTVSEEENPYYYFTHPTLKRWTSSGPPPPPLPKGVPMTKCNSW